jgi:hypothetical protein
MASSRPARPRAALVVSRVNGDTLYFNSESLALDYFRISAEGWAKDDGLVARAAALRTACETHSALNDLAGQSSHSLAQAEQRAACSLTRGEVSAVRSIRRKANNARHDWPRSGSSSTSTLLPGAPLLLPEPCRLDAVLPRDVPGGALVWEDGIRNPPHVVPVPRADQNRKGAPHWGEVVDRLLQASRHKTFCATGLEREALVAQDIIADAGVANSSGIWEPLPSSPTRWSLLKVSEPISTLSAISCRVPAGELGAFLALDDVGDARVVFPRFHELHADPLQWVHKDDIGKLLMQPPSCELHSSIGT